TIAVTAQDAAGHTDTATAQTVFRSGVSGVLQQGENDAAFVANATVELRTTAGALVATDTTDGSGAFDLDTTQVNQDYLFIAKAPGYMTHSETVTVPDDERLSLVIPLSAGESVGGGGTVTFLEPADNANLTGDSVVVVAAT